MLLLLDLMCVAGVAWAAVLIGGLLAGVRLLPTGVAVIVTAALVLPGFTAGLITNRRVVLGRKPQSGWIRSVWAPPDLPHWGLVLSGLVFAGDAGGNLVAYDSTTGVPLWHSRIGNVSAPPQTYMLDGRQYLLVAVGDRLYAFTLY